MDRRGTRHLISLVLAFGAILMVLTVMRRATTAASPLHFVDDANQPLAAADIRLICYEGTAAALPLLDKVVKTDALGQPTELISDRCTHLLALQLMREQPGKAGHGPAYWLYQTNWQAGTAVRPIIPPSGEIKISAENQLVLFNIVASLEWEPEPGSPFPGQLQQGLREASAFLYDLTEGQMAFGPVTILTGGEGWDAADFRFRAANDFRPAAHVGGMMATPISYTPGTAAEPVYAPGAIFLGRYWNGATAFDSGSGNWTNPNAFRTLGHEFAHYALFLYDEYEEIGGTQNYCLCQTLPGAGCTFADLDASAMGYHYTASELWHTPTHGSPAACLSTQQFNVHGTDDWQTLSRWSLIQGFANGLNLPVNLMSGPTLGITADLFADLPGSAVHLPLVGRSGSLSNPTAEPSVISAIDTPLNPGESPIATLYLLEGGGESPTRILYQGVPIGSPQPDGKLGETTLFAPDAAAEVRLFVQRQTTEFGRKEGGRYVYPLPEEQPPPPLAADQLLLAKPDVWQANLDLSYGLTGSLFTSMTVHLNSTSPQLLAEPIAQLCSPDAAVGCHPEWRQTMTQVGPNDWTATFMPLRGFDELPLYAVVRVTADKVGERIVHYLAAGGVGPGHIDGYAPLADGPINASADTLIRGKCNRVFVATVANSLATETSLGVDNTGNPVVAYGGLVGGPLEVDILLPGPEGGCTNTGGGDHPLPFPVVLSLAYDPVALEQLGLKPDQLRVLRFLRFGGQEGRWQPTGIIDRSDSLNWLSFVVDSDGIVTLAFVP